MVLMLHKQHEDSMSGGMFKGVDRVSFLLGKVARSGVLYVILCDASTKRDSRWTINKRPPLPPNKKKKEIFGTHSFY